MKRPTSDYTKKRNFDITSEPPDNSSARRRGSKHALRFVIQKHDARRLHYDFRLELEGTLKSWAVPKGPSLDPNNKRLAVHVEDHPINYATFEGTIPHGQYGGGDVIVWDEGVWQPEGDASAAYKAGKLKFTLLGEKLSGAWTLVKTRLRGNSDKEQWLLIKEHDAFARPEAEYDIVADRPQSVITGDVLPIDKIARTPPLSQAASLSANQALVKKSLKPPVEKNNKKTADKKQISLSTLKTTIIPNTFSPELATLVNAPPEGDWLYEIKFDGYRMLARILKGAVTLFTRNGNDWNKRLPRQVEAIAKLNLKDSWLDGEVVVLNENGLPSFQALQNAFDQANSRHIIFYLFDAPFLNGIDLRERPVEVRRDALEKILARYNGEVLKYSATIDGDYHTIVKSACALSLEGVIGKRIGSTYVSRRSADWIKLKCRLRQEFIIIGYTDPQRSRSHFGAILLGVYADVKKSALIYAGRVGTGFSENSLDSLYKKMHALECDTSPVTTKLTGTHARGVHWVKPKLVCEVEFAQWTTEGILRQATFVSLRSDKPAKAIIRERALAVNATGGEHTADTKIKTRTKTRKNSINGVTITHPDRVLDSLSGATKADVARFYKNIAKFILPHLSHRPVALLRAPDGIAGEQFFQKHADNRAIPNITQLDAALDPGHGPLIEIATVDALLGCAQMNAIELHTWGAKSTAIETPDRFVLDLDPDPALPWRSVVEATQLALAVLDELKLDAFLKTTGGKGMHIIVPLTPEASWDYVKKFSKSIAEFMARQLPERFVAKMGPQNRIGKIFTDYLRNSRGGSTVCAYSVRARPGLTVSVPISREELVKISHSNQWHIGNLHERLNTLKIDPWPGYSGDKYKKTQKITTAMWKKLGFTEPKNSM